jgi:hypothetical protein
MPFFRDTNQLLSQTCRWENIGQSAFLLVDLIAYFVLPDLLIYYRSVHTKLNSVAFSPQVNYTNRATAVCRRSYCQRLRIESVAGSAQRIPAAVNLGFLDRSRYFSIQVAPQLSSRC